ncbi:MAG: RecX family transcriptional regulator [Clostridia bacterium]|nr:RecX family transcriptional regulator [Clostridia bacterium]
MKITDIKRKGKSEVYKVFADGEFFSLMQAEVLVKKNIKLGQDIDGDSLKEYKKESDMLLCKTMALTYVSKSIKTEFQVRAYLKKYGFEKTAIDEAIKKLKEYGYLNDEYYAKLYCGSMANGRGKRYIKNELRLKGISEENIQQAISEIDSEEDACIMQANKWLKGKELPLDKKSKEKLYRFLLGRGFEYDTIKSALNKIMDSCFNDENCD